MDAGEYLAFVPLLIYGIGLADLLGEWKRLFNPDEFYLPYILFTIILTEVAVFNIFIYVDLINQLEGQTYLTYLSFLLPPFLFLMVTNVFTPDSNEHTREYFDSKMPITFTLAAIFIASHFLYKMDGNNYIRLIMIALLLLIAVFKKKWMIYVVAVLWLAGLVMRSSLVTT